MDAYRSKNKIILWLKTADKDVRVKIKARFWVYIEPRRDVERFLDRHNVRYRTVKRRNCFWKLTRVIEVEVPNIGLFEGFVRAIEKNFGYRIRLYDADIKPEQMFLYKHDLKPFQAVVIEGNNVKGLDEGASVVLKRINGIKFIYLHERKTFHVRLLRWI